MFVNDSSSIPLFLMLPSFSHHFSIIFPHVSHIFPQFVINYPSLFQILKHRGTASDAPVESTSWHPQPSPFRSEGCSPARSSGCFDAEWAENSPTNEVTRNQKTWADFTGFHQQHRWRSKLK